jgi:peptide chain release factor subunit 1
MEKKVYQLKKLLQELEKIKGRHTELVSVYVPVGYSLNDIMTQLKNEQGTAINIKSKSTKKNVLGALERIIQHLRIYKKTPENGLALFSGNVSEQEGAPNIKIWAIEPPEKLNVKLYWCDQKFELEPLKDMVAEKELFGLVVMDNKEASVAVLRGKKIELLRKLDSIVPGKTGKGGQSAQRFERVREGLINDFYKQIADTIKERFEVKKLKGIILGGPGPAKNDFFDGDYLQTNIKKLILGIKNTGYTDEQGLEELVERAQDLLAEAAVAREKILVQKFFEELRKNSKLVIYGIKPVLRVLKMGAIETILVSENLDLNQYEFQCDCGYSEEAFDVTGEKQCPKCDKKMKILGERDVIETLEEISEEYGTKVEIISRDTREGSQLFEIGGVAAILRYKIE